MDEFDARAEDEVVLADGTVLVRVWHGARVHPVTGVKGGLMSYPAADPAPDPDHDPAPTTTPEPDRDATPTTDRRVVCPVCHKVQFLPGWLARRFRTCSRRCAMLARHDQSGR